MIATARICKTNDGPVLQIMPQPRTEEERAFVALLADRLPLRFLVSRETCAALNVDAAEVSHELICAWAR